MSGSQIVGMGTLSFDTAGKLIKRLLRDPYWVGQDRKI